MKWEDVTERVNSLDRAHVKVGVLQSQGGNQIHDPESGLTMTEIAAIHEFGSPAAGIPERSFIRSTFNVVRAADLQALVRRLAKQVVHAQMPITQALGILGQWGAAAVKNTIRTKRTIGPEPQELKPATIAAKGSSTPLVDTGRLLNTINYEVVEE